MDDGFGEYLRICGSRKKAVVGLAVSAAAIVGGVYMLIDGAGWFSWVFIGFASLMSIGSLAGLMPGCSYLELDGEGFVCSGADMALPDTFGYEVEELAKLMNEFKRRSGSA